MGSRGRERNPLTTHQSQQHSVKTLPVVAQFDCHPEQAFFGAAKDLGEPREASRSLRRNNRALGSLPSQLHHHLLVQDIALAQL